MATDLIHDRGRGPELIGTRITVFNLLIDFLDSTLTEADICKLYGLTSEQVAAARAYILNNPESVLADHLKIEKRLAVGNPPEVVEKAEEIHATFMSFKKWLVEREHAESQRHESASQSASSDLPRLPTFREWLAEQASRTTERP